MTIEEKKEILLKKEKLKEKLENKQNKIKDIYYYEQFELINEIDKYMGFKEKEIFIVEKEEIIKGEKIKTFEIYNKDENQIATVDKEGLITLNTEYKEHLKETLKEYYSNLGLEDKERKMYLNEYEYTQNKENFVSKEKGFAVDDKPKEMQSKVKQIKEIRENRKSKVDILEPALLEEDLGLNANDIGAMIKIKDKRFYEKVPEAKQYDGDAILAYNKRTNKFIILGMKNGKYEECDRVEPSVGTMKTSVDLDRTGEKVEKQAISGVMKLKGNDDYDFAVNLELGGTIEFQELRKDKDGKYISADLQVQGQYATTYEVEKLMDKRKNHYIYDEREEFEAEQKHGQKSTVKSIQEKECTEEEKQGKSHDEDEEEWERGFPRKRR